MKHILLMSYLSFFLMPCFGQDVKGFVLQKYEELFSVKDTIFSSGIFGVDYRIRDITLAKSKVNFFKSIQSVEVVLDCPSLTTVQINFDSDTLFVPVGFFINNSEHEDCCCHCEDTIIDERLKSLDNESKHIEWQFRVSQIFDSDGQSMDIEQETNYHYLKNPAVVRDKDGYVNVREERSGSSKVVDIIQESEVIYYTPSVISNWWRVYREHGNKFLGYVHKSRILTYEYCSPEMKRKIEHEMH